MMQAAVRPGMREAFVSPLYSGKCCVDYSGRIFLHRRYLASILQWVQSAPGEEFPFSYSVYILQPCVFRRCSLSFLWQEGKSVFALSEKNLQMPAQVKLLYAVLFLAVALFFAVYA